MTFGGTHDWRHAASCRDTDPSMFFGLEVETKEQRVARERQAVRVCRACPVRRPCGDFAVGNVVRYGVWGGMTEMTREAVTR